MALPSRSGQSSRDPGSKGAGEEFDNRSYSTEAGELFAADATDNTLHHSASRCLIKSQPSETRFPYCTIIVNYRHSGKVHRHRDHSVADISSMGCLQGRNKFPKQGAIKAFCNSCPHLLASGCVLGRDISRTAFLLSPVKVISIELVLLSTMSVNTRQLSLKSRKDEFCVGCDMVDTWPGKAKCHLNLYNSWSKLMADVLTLKVNASTTKSLSMAHVRHI